MPARKAKKSYFTPVFTAERSHIMFTKVAENLKKLGYQVTLFDTKEQAADYLCGEIKDTTVGFGGSITLLDMGLYDRLQETNKVRSTKFFNSRILPG